MLDLKKSELTDEQFETLSTLICPDDDGGSFRVVLEPQTVARAQLAKVLLGPGGVLRWLNYLAAFETNIQVCELAVRLGLAARDAGLKWPMKEAK